MAAAASSRSKGGLFFLLTLLCLVGLASSRKDDNNLDNLKAKIQKTEDQINHLKARKDFFSTLMSETKRFTEQTMAAFEKVLSEESADDYLPLKNLFQAFLTLSDSARAFLITDEEGYDAEIANIKLELEKSKRLVRALEEYQSEL